MIKILTNDFLELDIYSDMDFEFVMENPMLDNEGIPIPFTTQIDFPPSSKNIKIFKYIPAIMCEPEIKSLPVSILICGVPIMSGMLKYDSIDNGKLVYSFTSDFIGNVGKEKIWKHSITPFLSSEIGILTRRAKHEKIGYCFPVMIRDYRIMEPDSRDRYENYPGGRYTNYYNTTPAIFLYKILEALPSLVIDDNIKELYTRLAIIGTYRPDLSIYRPGAYSFIERKDICEYLPDITFSDILKNTAHIFCATIYSTNRGELEFVQNNSVFSSDPCNIEHNISDVFSLCQVPGVSYKFGFNEKPYKYDRKKIKTDIIRHKIDKTTKGIEQIPDLFNAKEYTAIYCPETGDIYSGKVTGKNTKEKREVTCDIVSRDIEEITTTSGNNSGNFDYSCAFSQIKTIPERIWGDRNYVAAPVYMVDDAINKRDDKVFIGVCENEQMTNHGYFVKGNGMEGEPGTYSILPKVLYEKYHKSFAEWMMKDRQEVSVDLCFLPNEFMKIKLSEPFYFKGRKWIAKKLSFRFHEGMTAIRGTGSFVSL